MFQYNNLQGEIYLIKTTQAQYQLDYFNFITHKSGM